MRRSRSARLTAVAAAVTALGLLGSACGSGDDPVETGTDAPGETPADGASGSVGAGADGDADDVAAPWNVDVPELADATLLDTTELSVEAVAALDPDVIFGSWTVSESADVHAQLSEIAPTIGILGDGVDGSWEEVTRTVGQVLDREDEAEAAIDATLAVLDDTRTELPDLEGLTQALAVVYDPATLGVIVDPESEVTRFFDALGLGVAPGIADLRGEEQNSLSAERLDLLDGDVLVIGAFDPELVDGLTDDPRFQRIPAVEAGAYAVLDRPMLMGVRTPTVRNVPTLLEAIRPALDIAAAG